MVKKKKEASEKWLMKDCTLQILEYFCSSFIRENNINQLRVDLYTIYL